MPITGPKPKAPELLRNQSPRAAHDWIEVPDRPYRGRKPKLPKETSAATQSWWRALSSMPHCVLWGPSDWAFAVDTARLHDGFATYATEIRQREKVMGTTVDARRDLRIRYVSEVQDAEPAPLSIEELRRQVFGG